MDNKQSGSRIPINEEHYGISLTDLAKLILLLLAIVLLIIILAPILPYIIKFVIWLVALPFKAVAALMNSIRKRKYDKPKKGAKSVEMPHIEGDLHTVSKQKAKTPKYKHNSGA